MKKKYNNNNTYLSIDPNAMGAEYETTNLEVLGESYPNGLAQINIWGPLEHKVNSVWDSYDEIEDRIRFAAADPTCKCILLNIDSPGGECAGSIECHKNIKAISKKYNKPIFAFVDETAASAAYAIASAAEEIWIPPTGTVGSIGVIATVADCSKANEQAGVNIVLLTTGDHKADGNPNQPLDKNSLKAMQERVDYLGLQFFDVVAKSRNMSVESVKALQANVFQGSTAVSVGLADNVGSMSEMLEYISILIETNGQTTSSNTKSLSKKESEQMLKLSLLKEIAEMESQLSDVLFDSKMSKEQIVEKIKELKNKLATAKTEEEKSAEKKVDEEKSQEDDEEELDSKVKSSEDEDEDEDEEEDEDVVEEKKSKKSVKAQIMELVQALTEQTDLDSVVGALEAMIEIKANAPALNAKLAEIEVNQLKTKTMDLLNAAKSDGKVSPHQITSLAERVKNEKDLKWLGGYLSALPKSINVISSVVEIPIVSSSSALENLSKDQKVMCKELARSLGRDPEDMAKEMLSKNVKSTKF
jgi:signal peptide peptidase SppA